MGIQGGAARIRRSLQCSPFHRAYIPLPPSQNTNAPLPSGDEYRNTILNKTAIGPQEFQTLPFIIFTVLEVHADGSALTSPQASSNISGKQTTDSSFVSGSCPPTPAFIAYSDAIYSDLVLVANSNVHHDRGGM